MPLTRQEIILKAQRQSAVNARRRRFARFADEIKNHPEDLDETACNALAEALVDCGWVVHVPA